MQEPTSMEECIYFTRRIIGNGNVMAWVFKEKCKKCGKALMGKPTDSKGKVLIRAKEYICKECGYTVEKQDYEDSLTCNIKYTCPKCGFIGKTQVPFKRKNFQGTQAIVFQCEKCNEKIPITKKMKELK